MTSNRFGIAAGALALLMFPGMASLAPAADFGSGNVVVLRVGDGSAALTSAATAVFLDEFNTTATAQTALQSIALPTAVNGANKRVTDSGSSTSTGQMTRTSNGAYLVISGYDAAPGTASVTGTASATTNRVIARVDHTGAIDSTTALTDAYSGNNFRGVASFDGSSFYTAGTGTNPGVRYATLGATTSTQLSTTVTNIRTVQLFNGQLYCSSGSGSFVGVSAVGTGVPTASGNTITLLPGFSNTLTPSPYAFYFADANTIWLADDSANANGGIQKWTLGSGTWSRAAVYQSTTNIGCRALTGRVEGGALVLYAITADAAPKLVKFDVNSTTFTTLATSPANTVFRGVALAPAAPAPTEPLTAASGAWALYE